AGGRGGDLTDRQLLRLYADRRDEEAFAKFVRRHGRLVLGVCWRGLPPAPGAGDAHQATVFLPAPKAGPPPRRRAVRNRLYQTAYRLAAEARTRAARRRRHERRAADMLERPHPAGPDHRELAELIDLELRKLPERFRAPLLLCYLEGHAVDQAAAQLGWS